MKLTGNYSVREGKHQELIRKLSQGGRVTHCENGEHTLQAVSDSGEGISDYIENRGFGSQEFDGTTRPFKTSELHPEIFDDIDAEVHIEEDGELRYEGSLTAEGYGVETTEDGRRLIPENYRDETEFEVMVKGHLVDLGSPQDYLEPKPSQDSSKCPIEDGLDTL